MILTPCCPSRVLSWKEFSLGPTLLFFSICQHKHQLQHFNEGSYHGDGSNTCKWRLLQPRGGAQTEATSHLPFARCRAACSEEARLAAGPEAREAHGPCFKWTLAFSPSHHAQLGNAIFISTFSWLTLWTCIGPKIHCAIPNRREF